MIFFIECKCNLEGSTTFICDWETGICDCKSENIIGNKCDQSIPGWWDFPNPQGRVHVKFSCLFVIMDLTRFLQNAYVIHKDLKELYVGKITDFAIVTQTLLVINVLNVMKSIMIFQIVKVRNIIGYTFYT